MEEARGLGVLGGAVVFVVAVHDEADEVPFEEVVVHEEELPVVEGLEDRRPEVPVVALLLEELSSSILFLLGSCRVLLLEVVVVGEPGRPSVEGDADEAVLFKGDLGDGGKGMGIVEPVVAARREVGLPPLAEALVEGREVQEGPGVDDVVVRDDLRQDQDPIRRPGQADEERQPRLDVVCRVVPLLFADRQRVQRMAVVGEVLSFSFFPLVLFFFVVLFG
mmetsp:Transcript_34201/g.109828  ORF Transcript_34201/g.109828 Transcript_34201/m.109828 type:complete len:221 (-) Transcript_34201:2398-3060(-)